MLRKKTSVKRLRVLGRCSGLAPGGSSLDVDGLSFLEQTSVQDKSREVYEQEITGYRNWSRPLRVETASDAEVETSVVRWLNRLFFDGHHCSRGERLAAAFLFYHPNSGKLGKRTTARLWRALKGWRRRAPPRSWRPRSWLEVAGIAMYLIERGEYMKAIWTLMFFGGNLRPSYLMKLRRQDLVPPVGSLSSQWCLVLNSEDYGDTSKTGVSDESSHLGQHRDEVSRRGVLGDQGTGATEVEHLGLRL